MWLRLLPMLLVASGVLFWYAGRPVQHPPGILVAEAPRQERVTEPEAIRHRGYQLTPVARFEAKARLLGKKRYRSDATAGLAPYDLAIGWGPMSDTSILEQYDIIQQQRVYRWHSEQRPLPTKTVILNSTNLHVIPATAAVSARLARLREGHVVELRGRLVDVLSNDGNRWKTSTTRSDAGVGACEIVWLESIEVAAE